MTDEKVTQRDITGRHTYSGNETEAAKIIALGNLAIAQSIDGLTKQLKRVIDTEFDPEE